MVANHGAERKQEGEWGAVGVLNAFPALYAALACGRFSSPCSISFSAGTRKAVNYA